MLHRLSCLVLAVLIGACATAPAPNSKLDEPTRQAALDKAHKAVAKRGWTLPDGYKVTVERSEFIPELQESWYEDIVTFTRPRPNKSAAPLYRVTIRSSTGEVTGVDDERKNVQDEEVAAARRAFEQKYHLTRKDYITISGPTDRNVEVTFLFDKVPRVPGRLTPQRHVVAIVDRSTLKVKSLTERYD